MAVMKGCSYEPVVGSGYPLMTAHDFVVIHTIVGFDDGGSAAHWTTRADGLKRQRRDTKYQSEANLNGNHNALAIENEDHGPDYGNWNTNDGHQVPAFTGPQCESIAEILAWSYQTYGIPLVLVVDTKPGRRGIAYHRQGIDGNYIGNGFKYGGRVAGGVRWSNKTGKVCPGDRRIEQLEKVIIPRARVLAGLDPAPSSEEDDMNGTPWLMKCGDFPLGVLAINGEFVGMASAAEMTNVQNAGAKAVWMENATVREMVRVSRIDEGIAEDLAEIQQQMAEEAGLPTSPPE